jgi:hypothetical protein
MVNNQQIAHMSSLAITQISKGSTLRVQNGDVLLIARRRRGKYILLLKDTIACETLQYRSLQQLEHALNVYLRDTDRLTFVGGRK